MRNTPPEDGIEQRRLTLEEWADLPEDDEGELVDGILVEEEMGGLAHESVVAWLIQTLGAWLAGRGGRVAASEPSPLRAAANPTSSPGLPR